MGQKRKWDEEKILDYIKEVVEELGIDRFPTHKEIYNYYFDKELLRNIVETGGTRYWCKKMGLKMKDCESSLGEEFEIKCLCSLQDLGYEVEIMKTRHPYDLAVNKNIKVDVKSAFLYNSPQNTSFYTFNLEKNFPSCDIFVCYCLNEDKSVLKTYVIPSLFLCGKTQLSVGINISIYDKFIDRWDLFEQYDKFYKNIKV